MSQVAETIIFAISRCAQCLLMFQTYHLLCEIREPAKKKWFHVAMFAVAGVLLDVLTRPLVGLTTVTVCIAVLSSPYFFVLYHKPMVQSIAGSIISNGVYHILSDALSCNFN